MRSPTARVAALLVLLLVGAACGGDDGGSSAGDVATTSASTDAAPVASGPAETAAPTTAPDTTLAAGIPEGVVTYTDLSQDHTVDDVDYAQTPPVGGAHDPSWQECGVYDRPIRTERGVHSMEHGAVWITYSPDLPPDQVAAVAAVAAGHTHVLVSPFEGLPSPVVASAWGNQLVLESATDPRLAQFVAYFELGPQNPEPGVDC